MTERTVVVPTLTWNGVTTIRQTTAPTVASAAPGEPARAPGAFSPTAPAGGNPRTASVASSASLSGLVAADSAPPAQSTDPLRSAPTAGALRRVDHRSFKNVRRGC